LALLTQKKAKLCKKLILTLVLEKNVNFIRQKLAKIEENCYHNIDPWSLWFSVPAQQVNLRRSRAVAATSRRIVKQTI
jgi:hypothetical protein